MADARMPEKFYELARPMLPAEKEPGPQGGRPPVEHYIVLKVIWFVLVTGCRWKDVPKELGCCGETARTRLQAWEHDGIWDELHMLLLTLLRQANELHLETAIIDSTQVRAFGGGDATGPSPVDRRKKGTKYTLLVDREGVPLVIRSAEANQSDQLEILPAVLDFPAVPGKRGRPVTHPKKLYADAGYDCDATRSLLAGWASNHTFGAATRSTAVTSDECDGWSRERSVGSRACAACEYGTIDRPRPSTPGPVSPQPSYA
jgi:transposase